MSLKILRPSPKKMMIFVTLSLIASVFIYITAVNDADNCLVGGCSNLEGVAFASVLSYLPFVVIASYVLASVAAPAHDMKEDIYKARTPPPIITTEKTRTAMKGVSKRSKR